MALPVERIGSRVVDSRTNLQFLADEIGRHERSIRSGAKEILSLRRVGVSSQRVESQINRSLDALLARESHMDQELALEEKALLSSEDSRNAFLDSQLSMEVNGQLTRLTQEAIGAMSFSMFRRGLTGGVVE